MSDSYIDGRDAAFASNIGNDWPGVVAGYFGGPNAYHVWERSDWIPFHNRPKLPIWVSGYDADKEVAEALQALAAIGVPPGKHIPIALDLETRVDVTYVQKFVAAMHEAEFHVLLYGSADTVFGNPPANGYWVASWSPASPHMFTHPGVRGTQYAHDIPPGYDVSLWKSWVVLGMWR